MRWFLLFVLVASGALAQEAQIDLDRLSRIAYCAIVFKEQEAAFPLPGVCHQAQSAEQKFCIAFKNSLASLEAKRMRFAAYILARTINSDAALTAASIAMATAKADAAGCFSAVFRGINSSQLVSCRYVRNCQTVELPY